MTAAGDLAIVPKSGRNEVVSSVKEAELPQRARHASKSLAGIKGLEGSGGVHYR